MTEQSSKKNKRIWWYIGAGVIAGICLCVFAAFALLSPGATPSTASTSPASTSNQVASTSVPNPTKTPKPTNTPVLGTTRDNPLPGGQGVDLGNMTLTITNITLPADQELARGSMFNSTPAPDQEYAIVEIQVQCNKSTNDKCSFLPSYLEAVGADGQLREREIFISGIVGEMEPSYEFFGGSNISGNLVYLFPKDDQSVVLSYESLFGSPIYISLP